mgnify:CR=1 FL=1
MLLEFPYHLSTGQQQNNKTKYFKHTWPPGGPETPPCPLGPYVKNTYQDLVTVIS